MVSQFLDSEAHVHGVVAEAFRRAGWKVEQEMPHGQRIDLLVRKDDLAYVVEIKRASEGRSDRLIPLISQAILQAQAYARAYGGHVSPLAIVLAPRVPESAAEQIRQFAVENAPGVAVGVFDLEGLRLFQGQGLESLNQRHHGQPRKMKVMAVSRERRVGLFSGVNQWLLKVMLAPKIPESLLAAPRQEFRNASQLAQASRLSIMSAFRFVKQLQGEGFLDDSEGVLRLVRIEELMRRWQAWHSVSPSWRELRMRWIIRNDAPDAFYSAVRNALVSPELPRLRRFRAAAVPVIRAGRPIHVCAGLFSAAELLGLSFVHGGPHHLYVEEANPELFQLLGLVPASESESVDVFVRLSISRAIFHAAVDVDGVPASDVLQVWLDVAMHPARGSAQANEIWRRILAPSLGIR
jgi:hypothetical protein